MAFLLACGGEAAIVNTDPSGSLAGVDQAFDAVTVRPSANERLDCQILVVGGSTAAYSATLGALREGASVCLIQPSHVVGGQFTAQGLPASDDGSLTGQDADPAQGILSGESFSLSATQKAFRARERELQAVSNPNLRNPGRCWVSPLCTTPQVALRALNEKLEPFLQSGKLRLVSNSAPTAVHFASSSRGRQRVSAIDFRDESRGVDFSATGEMVIEATDLGDLLELGSIPSRIGQEARAETGEAALPEQACPRCQQAFTYDVLVERTAGGQGVAIGAPEGYGSEPWVSNYTSTYWHKDSSGAWGSSAFLDTYSIFDYRRAYAANTRPGASESSGAIEPGDISILNWACQVQGPAGYEACGNDYGGGVLVGVSREERAEQMRRARDRARGFVHFLQSEAAIPLKPRGDQSFTSDGIALDPYIREARRGIAMQTIVHSDVAKAFYPDSVRARSFPDSVGIGQYHYVDTHPNDEPGNLLLTGDQHLARPFSIPLKALVPVDTDGLILSSKSIGTTHITNAAYRMHPVEWAIGEASGILAAMSVSEGLEPRQIAVTDRLVRVLQARLTNAGVPLYWFDDVATDDHDFQAIHVLAAAGIIIQDSNQSLHYNPSQIELRAHAASALAGVLGLEPRYSATPRFSDVGPSHWAYGAIEALAAAGFVNGYPDGTFRPQEPITHEHLSFMVRNVAPEALDTCFADLDREQVPTQKREMARVMYQLLRYRLEL
jgi:hypothetical protein